MILLHLAVAALYAAATAAVLPPTPAQLAAGKRPADASVRWLVPAAIALHGWVVWQDIARADGLDLSFENALSAVAGLVAAIAWMSGLIRTLPVVGTVVLPVAAIAGLIPAFVENPHRFSFAGETWAVLHVAVALIAYSLFLVAALQALVLMSLEKRLRKRLPDPGADALPPLLTLETFLFRLVGAGFVLLTLTLASGMLFSEQVFGKPLTFTHKSVFSVLGWVTFGGLLWGRHRYGWRGRVALRWILVGTAFVFLAYLGYKFVLEVVLGR